ncbi:MAG: hypothetical protein Fur0041_06450 [Bacteroidia bacterium]
MLTRFDFPRMVALLCASLFFHIQTEAQQYELAAPLAFSNDSTQRPDFLKDKKRWKEIPSERKIYSSTYKTDDGRIIMEFSKKPLNYYDENGLLLHIDTETENNSNGWIAPHQPYPVQLNQNGSFVIAAGKNSAFTYGQNTRFNGVPVQVTLNTLHENTSRFSNIVPGADKEFVMKENALKYHYILHQPQNISGNYLIISEDITIPSGAVITQDVNMGKTENGLWFGDLMIKNAQGEEIGRISVPICFDESKNYTLGAYRIIPAWPANTFTVETLIPQSWLNDASRDYPVVIDPLITGPTALWTGGIMPSCVIPNYNIDSIQVTIPAQISVTGFFVTSSFYANPFTTAVMADGDMFFSTSCNQSQSFTVQPPAGNTPGTAYLQAFNLRVPLLCCFPQSCSAQTFYLRMHLGRTIPNTGCNATHIYYNPTTTWPFSAYVEGRTVESYGQQWSVPQTPICRNQCTITANAQVRYGVPPYTFSHPWMTGTVNAGNPAGCNYGNINKQLTLNIPNCPSLCDTTPFIVVPPPVITDACGNVVQGIPADTLWVKPVPVVTATPPSFTNCSGQPFSVTLSSCLSNSVVNWYGNNSSGQGTLTDTVFNTGSSALLKYYSAYSVLNGCSSDTVNITVTTDPYPAAAFTASPQPGIVNIPVGFTDNTQVFAGILNNWIWDFGDGDTAMTQNSNHTYNAPGTYNVCLYVVTDHNCPDTVCNTIEVIPAEVVAPNVFTPNGDGVNDVLSFQYLEFYQDNQLSVYNRWGNLIYEKSSYTNDWNGSTHPDGTYYYVLRIGNGQLLKGYFQLIR